MVNTRRAATERARAAAMAFSKLSGDKQGVILGQLRNALEPRLVMYFSSANKELRALLPPAAQQQLTRPRGRARPGARPPGRSAHATRSRSSQGNTLRQGKTYTI